MSDRYEFEALARYNSEVERGICHTPEWKAKMAEEQARFDRQYFVGEMDTDDHGEHRIWTEYRRRRWPRRAVGAGGRP